MLVVLDTQKSYHLKKNWCQRLHKSYTPFVLVSTKENVITKFKHWTTWLLKNINSISQGLGKVQKVKKFRGFFISKSIVKSFSKKKNKRGVFRYLLRPLLVLSGQPIVFSWSLRKRKTRITYHKFLKTHSVSFISRTMWLCLVIKEPSYFLIPYASMLTDLDMFTHRRLLRLAQSSLYWFILFNFGILLGFYFSCAGKISVGGNARTRTMLKSYGYRSSSLLLTQTTNTFAIINTITGCLGLWLVFFY